ncbi:MAG: heterodisulfide reductase subunit C [Spirochaetes bacterium]|nr:4Fe-4S dicluster domain-containing protein [Deltaproteobacteria bacterium]RKY03579.1 MAG: heterodisulfide reductase subunit C [Spirochaetota bacterium]
MALINLTTSTDENFVNQVETLSGQKISECYQCGKCTAGCPFSFAFDYPVSQIMRLIQIGQKEIVLNSKAIWLCATCEACTTRCPCQIDVANVMDICRIIARKENKVKEKDVKLFYDIFLESVKKHGRIFEIEILMKYNLKSGKLLTDADLGPKILPKGKLNFFPVNIKGKDSVEKIFTRFVEGIKNNE